MGCLQMLLWDRFMMGRKNQILIFMVILTGLLFACSGGDGKSRQGQASDSGITGQAVTDGCTRERNTGSVISTACIIQRSSQDI